MLPSVDGGAYGVRLLFWLLGGWAYAIRPYNVPCGCNVPIRLLSVGGGVYGVRPLFWLLKGWAYAIRPYDAPCVCNAPIQCHHMWGAVGCNLSSGHVAGLLWM